MMPRNRLRFTALLGFALAWLGAAPAASASPEFDRWLQAFRAEARAAGVSEATLAAALDGLAPSARVIELDTAQPEFLSTFWQYYDRAVSPSRVDRGRELMARHAGLLSEIEAAYGVQPRFIIALWGLETDFGGFMGSFPVIEATATLAYEGRREALFRAQLLDALYLADQGDLRPEQMIGSWAGGMGHVQFIPSTYRAYAVDFDGDGRRDLYGSLADAFASAAHFLSQLGWRGDETWGRQVRVPSGFDWHLANSGTRLPLADWAAMGVTRWNGRPLPVIGDMQGRIVAPLGHRGPVFLGYGNYDAILGWNRSSFYAIAVGSLADQLVGAPPRTAPRPEIGPRLNARQVAEMQERLNRLGYDAGRVDGRTGSRTRAALRAYQAALNQPPDGYATEALLTQLRRDTAGR